jgi:hypothetical protein
MESKELAKRTEIYNAGESDKTGREADARFSAAATSRDPRQRCQWKKGKGEARNSCEVGREDKPLGKKKPPIARFR